jgi:preprotein translocase subunit SecD
MKEWLDSFGAIAAAVVGLAIVAVLVSRNARTPDVISSVGSAFSGIIQAAVSPITEVGGTIGGIMR